MITRWVAPGLFFSVLCCSCSRAPKPPPIVTVVRPIASSLAKNQADEKTVDWNATLAAAAI
jgi:hypothetical protein